jgi:D-alanyl-D-alanine carboxypeptidase/D-alanyl-D-alanine-endopeptidase (penicillin-binding protein 4)
MRHPARARRASHLFSLRALAPVAVLAWLTMAGAAAQQPDPRPAPPTRPETASTAEAVESDLLTLRDNLERLLDDPALGRAHVGMVVQAAASGRILFERGGRKRFTAASTTKLVTASVGLHRLGSDFRWTTRLVADGLIRDGVLRGDLWVIGGGDPSLSRNDLQDWAELLQQAGIGRIEGDVIGDDRAFDALPWGRGWMWDDLYAAWGAGVSALQLSPSRIRAELRPAAEVGSPAELHVLDEGPRPAMRNRVRTGAPGSEVRLRFVPSAAGAPVGLEGWIPADEERVPLALAPEHPTVYLLDHLEEVLAGRGIEVGGSFRRPLDSERAPVAPDREGEDPWAVEVRGEPLAATLEPLLKRSDNQVAELLLRTLGRELGDGGTAEDGLEVVHETLSEWGIEPDAAALADGSGMSRYSELTPNALVRLLRRMWQLPEFEALAEALPVAGVDGTLARRLVATAADSNLRAKTGSMTGVRGLAGYVTDGGGETLVFAVLLNGYDAPGEVATAVEDLLIEQLALYHGAGGSRGVR